MVKTVEACSACENYQKFNVSTRNYVGNVLMENTSVNGGILKLCKVSIGVGFEKDLSGCR